MVVELRNAVAAFKASSAFFFSRVHVIVADAGRLVRHILKSTRWSVSEAIELIVDGYFGLKDRQALEDLRAHRQALIKQLQDQRNELVDIGPSVRLFEKDLHVIDAAIDRL